MRDELSADGQRRAKSGAASPAVITGDGVLGYADCRLNVTSVPDVDLCQILNVSLREGRPTFMTRRSGRRLPSVRAEWGAKHAAAARYS